MIMDGRVVGGHFLDASVTRAAWGSDLVVQSGLSWRKLNAKNVSSWQEVPAEAGTGAAGMVSRAVAGAVVPRVFSKAAVAAAGAAFDAKARPPRMIRISWLDGKESLIKLPEKLFVHVELVLADLRIEPAVPSVVHVDGDPVSVSPASVTEQALALVSDFLGDDAVEQLDRLAGLRDRGVITEEEFSAKKAQILDRM
jgi:hypothetical protein